LIFFVWHGGDEQERWLVWVSLYNNEQFFRS
jgi:hypothetical protein